MTDRYTCVYTFGVAEEVLTLREARARLSEIVDRARRLGERFVITQRGRPGAVLLSREEFEGWIETLEIAADSQTRRRLGRGLSDARAGRRRSFREVFGEEV